jgi:hypothetical protein
MGSTSTRSIASLSCYLRSRVRPTKTTPQEGSSTILTADAYHHRDFLIPNIALTPTQSFPISLTYPKTPRRSPTPYRKINPPPHYFDLSTASGQTSSLDLFPAEADQVINVFANVITSTLDLNKPKGRMNDTSWKVQETPPLPLLALDREQWDKNQLVPWTGKDPKWVDIVVNNIDFTGHPFHLVSKYHPIPTHRDQGEEP